MTCIKSGKSIPYPEAKDDKRPLGAQLSQFNAEWKRLTKRLEKKKTMEEQTAQLLVEMCYDLKQIKESIINKQRRNTKWKTEKMQVKF